MVVETLNQEPCQVKLKTEFSELCDAEYESLSNLCDREEKSSTQKHSTDEVMKSKKKTLLRYGFLTTI